MMLFQKRILVNFTLLFQNYKLLAGHNCPLGYIYKTVVLLSTIPFVIYQVSRLFYILYRFFQKPRPSIFPAKKWSKLCPIYVDRLDKAMDGIGTDEQSLIEIICGCSSEQRSKLKSAFKARRMLKKQKKSCCFAPPKKPSDYFYELAIFGYFPLSNQKMVKIEVVANTNCYSRLLK